MVKRGLIISYYFPPTGGGGVQRWAKLIKYLQPLGWEFSVLTSEYSSENPRDETLLKEIPTNTTIIRIPNSSPRIKLNSKIPFLKSGYWQRWISAFINVTDSRESWNSKVKSYITRELDKKNYDLIIVSSPPYSLGIIAADLSRNLSIPVILDLRDPWTINPYKIHPTWIHRYIDKKREEASIGKINYMIAAYKSTLEDYSQRIPGFDEKKRLLLPNGFDEEDFHDLRDLNYTMEADLNIGFSGSFYSHLNKPDRLFRAIRILKDDNIHVCFHHIGSSVQNLKTMAQEYGIEDNIKLWGYKSHGECLELLSLMDVLCMILDSNWRNSQYTIGGKFYEYLRQKKPILALVPAEGEAARAIRETDSGIVVSENHISEIVNALKKIFNREKSFSWSGIEKFNRKEQARNLNKFLLNEVLGIPGKR